jgi:catechol 2,3-dioxygenase-like lactoylglutathione lyase family enzyme
MMKYGHTEIFVSDPMTSKIFYESILGFEVIDVQDDKYVWLKSDGAHFLLRPGRMNDQIDSYSSSKSAFVIYTEDLEESIATLESRGLKFKGSDGSPKCPTFTDPDGNWFQLVNPNDH